MKVFGFISLEVFTNILFQFQILSTSSGACGSRISGCCSLLLLEREPAVRIRCLLHLALRHRTPRHVVSEQRCAHVGHASVRHTNQPGREPDSRSGSGWRRIPQLPPHLPAGLFDERVRVAIQPHNILHRFLCYDWSSFTSKENGARSRC